MEFHEHKRFHHGGVPWTSVLVERGSINGERKTLHPGKVVAAFMLGTQKLYDFVHDNPESLLESASDLEVLHVV